MRARRYGRLPAGTVAAVAAVVIAGWAPLAPATDLVVDLAVELAIGLGFATSAERTLPHAVLPSPQSCGFMFAFGSKTKRRESRILWLQRFRSKSPQLRNILFGYIMSNLAQAKGILPTLRVFELYCIIANYECLSA